MNKLDRIAIENLELLNDLTDNIEEYQLVVDGHVITQSDEENYEGIFNLKELEKNKLQDLLKDAEEESNKPEITDQMKYLADQKVDVLKSLN